MQFSLFVTEKCRAISVIFARNLAIDLTRLARTMAFMEKRGVGIPGIDRVEWGDHICVFFYRKTELLRLTISYIKAGLEDGEFCMWITGDPVNEVEAFQALEQVLPNAADYLVQKQLEILPHTQWYLSGVFDADMVLHNWVSKARHAEAKGFTGLRITGNPFWLQTDKDWSQFGAYEEAVTSAIRFEHVIALCTYPRANLSESPCAPSPLHTSLDSFRRK